MPAKKRIMVTDTQQQTQLIAQFVREVTQQFPLAHSDEAQVVFSGFCTFVQLAAEACTAHPPPINTSEGASGLFIAS